MEVNLFESSHPLLFNNYRKYLKFDEKRIVFTSAVPGCELWGHLFGYNAPKSAELISFEWISFMVIMHLNLPLLKRDMSHGNMR